MWIASTRVPQAISRFVPLGLRARQLARWIKLELKRAVVDRGSRGDRRGGFLIAARSLGFEDTLLWPSTTPAVIARELAITLSTVRIRLFRHRLSW
jgi:hypothetical protein